MKNLREYIEEQKTLSRKYIAIIYDDETQKKLRKWCQDNGFDLTKSYSGNDQKAEDFQFHTTVIYSTNKSLLENNPHASIEKTPVYPKDFKLLDENHDIPVLRLNYSEEIRNLRSYYEGLGLKDAWPDYKPHISLSYVRDPNYDLKKLRLPTFTMTFEALKIEDIKEDI